MIASLKGKVILKKQDFIILNVAGVGYKITCPSFILEKIKKEDDLHLFTHLYFSQERIALYGFLRHDELEFFEMLISISGIGPKAALGILALAPVRALKDAIAQEDVSLLTKVSGIGKKTAERVILELKSKIKMDIGGVKGTSSLSQAIDALLGLGYTISQAREALSKIPKSADSIEEKVREALKQL